MNRQEYWRAHVDRYQSGEAKPLTVYCRENDLAYQTMLYWFRKLTKDSVPQGNGEFLPVKIEDPKAAKSIQVKLGDVGIELEKGFDHTLLKDVLSALRSAAC